MTSAQDHIADTLNRAQLCWDRTVGAGGDDTGDREALFLFLHHITTAVLLEHIRRFDEGKADQLTAWMLGQDSIFSDGYAGELLYQWRQQLAEGQPLAPIGPEAA